MNLSISDLWNFLVWGYLLTIALETPVLLAFLSRRHSWTTKLLASFWLTACTYPIVILVLPLLIGEPFGYIAYVAVAEVFAPVAECVLFLLLTRPNLERNLAASDTASDLPAETPATDASTAASVRQDCLAIVAANLTSFLVGLWLVSSW